MAGRTLNKLRKFKLEPKAATLALHLIYGPHGDRSQSLFAHFNPATSCGLRSSNRRLYSSAELRFLHEPNSTSSWVTRHINTELANVNPTVVSTKPRCS